MTHPPTCDARGPHRARCWLTAGHPGEHSGQVAWTSPAGDEDATLRMPPIRETTRARPPVPAPVRALTGPELIRALGEQLAREELEDAAAGREPCDRCPHTAADHSSDNGLCDECFCPGFVPAVYGL